ncbi:exodeoxyribonuclease III [Legionella birminghamensis]|uniref:exodeoxyribonuclease III n=1 Tax=Legionella birminghamensis TaxID=28083 RepID=UPI0007310EF9|nr:exodeoxyribonuclease III [Legionella birminghamensis]
MLKLASWNVNSLKIRLEQVIDWIQKNEVDILALQETKLLDDNFPANLFREMGYHVVFSGQKSYNGVAVISRSAPQEIVTDIPDLADPQRRILAMTFEGIRFINLYIPNGSTVGSDKYQYKLNWLAKMNAYIEEQLKQYPKLVVLGDFNIAPEDRDVHDPLEWVGGVMVSPEERLAFTNMLSLGLKDSFRLFPENEIEFTWWDYRAASFRRNRGLRIDHILLSHELVSCCLASRIDKEARGAERPSDHAPIWVELELGN